MDGKLVGSLVLCALVAGCPGGGDNGRDDGNGALVDGGAVGADAPSAIDAGAPLRDGSSPGDAAAAHSSPRPGVPASAFSNYESAHVHPLDITPDGTRLLAVNTANGMLETFDVGGERVTPGAVVKVGVDPVTVRAASNTEAWVVNVLSDSVSVVDLASSTVKATLATDDEPADVVFAGSPRRAFVSCAQGRTVMVFDPAQLAQAPARIPILGQQPRALATSPDGKRVYLGIFESGNGTTILGGKDSGVEPNIVGDRSGPYGGENPPPNAKNATAFSPPMNPANPPPPSGVSLIVRRTPSGDWLDDNGRSWKRFVSGGANASWGARARPAGWDLVDRDVAIVDAATRNVTYQGGMANIVMAIAVNPSSAQPLSQPRQLVSQRSLHPWAARHDVEGRQRRGREGRVRAELSGVPSGPNGARQRPPGPAAVRRRQLPSARALAELLPAHRPLVQRRDRQHRGLWFSAGRHLRLDAQPDAQRQPYGVHVRLQRLVPLYARRTRCAHGRGGHARRRLQAGDDLPGRRRRRGARAARESGRRRGDRARLQRVHRRGAARLCVSGVGRVPVRSRR